MSTKKGKAKPERPEGWTDKNEEELTYLVDEFFRVRGSEAVVSTRAVCEKKVKP